jgi:2-polyprenyl-6-methoxyphenol hydroxylase-like FAD-dependent oxidoreductase
MPTATGPVDPDSAIYDVVLIGYGPVGQAMAALLGQAGHSVAVFEQWPALYGRARAGHVDHEIMRIFQSVGIADQVVDDMFSVSKYKLWNKTGETLVEFDLGADGVSGWPSEYLIYQPSIEDALDSAVRAQPSVSVNQGWEATELVRHPDHVEVTLRQTSLTSAGEKISDSRTRTVRGRYLIGADGANSFVREQLGITRTDFEFKETWFVCDLEPMVPMDFGLDNGQICDPARPHCLFQLGRRHRRFEFALLPGEDQERFCDSRIAWQLLAPYGVTPERADLVRHALYTFEGKLASRWRDGRVMLIGDAAHVMPPFMGQGMCSGLRDAKGLAWRLDLVLRGVAGESILDSYEIERSPHVQSLIELSIEVGRISCTFDPDVAAARDDAFRRGDVPPPPPFPHLLGGQLDIGADGVAEHVVGRLAPQGRVRAGDRVGRMDDVVGSGWVVLLAAGVHAEFTPEQVVVLDRLDARVVALGDQAVTASQARAVVSDTVEDVDDYYKGYFERTGLAAILYRPDFYIFGAATEGAGVGTLIDALRTSLGLSLTEAAVAQ